MVLDQMVYKLLLALVLSSRDETCWALIFAVPIDVTHWTGLYFSLAGVGDVSDSTAVGSLGQE